MLMLVVETFWSSVAWDTSEQEMSFEREQTGERSALGEPVGEGEARWSCIRAFFLLSWRIEPRAGEYLQMLEAGILLMRHGPTGRLRRLS